MPANISGNSVSSLGCSFFSRPSFLGGEEGDSAILNGGESHHFLCESDE